MLKTPLHTAHINAGAKMGAFAGYDMPLYYDEGVKAEHLWTRQSAGLFDVSHMGQAWVRGAGATAFFETITPSAFAATPLTMSKYTVLTNEQGGIVDDLIITKVKDDEYFVVFNAGCKEKDIAWMTQHLPDDATFEEITDRSLIALQGPKAEDILREVLKIDASDLGYMRMMAEGCLPCGNDVYVNRLGYTGEDGFELSVPNDRAEPVWNALIKHEAVKPVGLAARDSLRLDMAYPLYGHDIDDTTSPVEADIAWVVQKKNERDFLGHARIRKEKETAEISRKRVGIKLLDKGVAREGAEILRVEDAGNAAAKPVSALTSGGFSPTLEASVGMGYVPLDMAALGTEIIIRVRGRDLKAEIVAMPFIEAQTKTKKKPKAA